MSSMAESKVGGVIKSLAELEDGLDSLNAKAAEMRKGLAVTAQEQIDKLVEEIRKTATAEAEKIISDARGKAQSQAEKISQEGEERLEKTQARIDTVFDEAVEYVVDTVLKK